MSEDIKHLTEACIKAKEHSYSPYSNFRVGAALLTDDGQIIKGCNVENVSYGLTICAERTAIVKAVSEGHKKFRAIAVTSDVLSNFTYPCGACRQFMAEFDNFDVYLVNAGGEVSKSTVSAMLPFIFDQQNLKQGQNTEKSN